MHYSTTSTTYLVIAFATDPSYYFARIIIPSSHSSGLDHTTFAIMVFIVIKAYLVGSTFDSIIVHNVVAAASAFRSCPADPSYYILPSTIVATTK